MLCAVRLARIGLFVFAPIAKIGAYAAERHEIRTKMAGEPARVWRSMRTVWRFESGEEESRRISDMLLRGDHVLYVCAAEAGCISKTTGKLLWKRPFLTKAQLDDSSFSPQYDWLKLGADDQLVYTLEGRWSGNAQPPVYHARAIRLDNGSMAWEKSLKVGAAGAPTPVGELLLIPLANGTIQAVNRANGSSVWEARVGSADCSLVLKAAGPHVVVQVGAYVLTALRLRDGSQVWAYPRNGHSDGNSDGPCVQGGVVYGMLGLGELVAIEIATGRTLWSKKTSGGGTPSPAVYALGDLVVTDPFGELVAVRMKDGHTAWIGERHKLEARRGGPMVLPWKRDPASSRSGRAVFDVLDGMPLINGKPRNIDAGAIWPPGTLVALDAATGRERWRWQPEDGILIQHVASDGERLYVSDSASVRAVEEGRPSPLPGDRKRREALAAECVTGYQLSSANKLTLLRLGAASVPALLKLVKKEVGEHDQRPVRPEDFTYHIYSLPDGLQDATFLLAEIADGSCIPPLVKELERAKHPIARMLLAKCLIRIDNPRSYDALLRYARTQPNDPSTQQDSLCILRTARRGTPISDRLTQLLLAAAADKNAPTWLRLFARFELLNDRGERARKAGLASFEGEKFARLSPGDLVLGPNGGPKSSRQSGGFASTQQAPSTVRDKDGKWWSAFIHDYLGSGSDLWFGQSSDGKNWGRAAFGMNLRFRCTHGGDPGQAKIRIVGDSIEVSWPEYVYGFTANKTFPHVDHLKVADVYRDSDGDGLTDLLEREIGTDPHNRDTNGDGGPDNIDKNAASRNHPQTDEESIFQSAVEALCQMGRSAPKKTEPLFNTKPIRFGATREPLALHPPPGSGGVRVLGHRGPVISRSFGSGGRPYGVLMGMSPGGEWTFTKPHIDLAGRYHDSYEWRRDSYGEGRDPFAGFTAAVKSLPAPSFRDYFPYEVSADRKRARVGWEQSLGGMDGECARYDVEVRKIGGRWYPIECRIVYSAVSRHWADAATLPNASAR